MNLKSFMSKSKFSDAEFAKAAGVSRGYIAQLRLGIRKAPSLRVALNIARASGGKVPVEAWGL
jgi:transcriptional regulator with XRE-family HTH domain